MKKTLVSIIAIIATIFVVVSSMEYSYTQEKNTKKDATTEEKEFGKYFQSIPYWKDDDYEISKEDALNRRSFYKVYYYSKNRPAMLDYYNNMQLAYRYYYNKEGIITKRESYKEGNLDGYIFEYINIRFYPMVRRKVLYDNGIPKATTLYTYYQNTRVRSEENFNGEVNFIPETETTPDGIVRDGYSRVYDRKGFNVYEVYFTNGLKDGEERISDFTGIDIDEMLESQGLNSSSMDEITKYKIFTGIFSRYKAGKVKTINHFSQGVRELQETLFDYQNNTKINVFYEKGNEVRKDITVKDELGRTIKITKFMDSTLPYGLWEYYDEDRNLIKTERYRNGLRHGEWQYYNYINDIRRVVKLEYYDDDKMESFSIFNYDYITGKRLDENKFNSIGQPQGEWFYYDEDDNLTHKQEYLNGVPNGIWVWWKVLEDRRLETQRYVIYKNGEVVETHKYEYDEND